MTYNCHLCNCADCRFSHLCERCMGCDGTAMNLPCPYKDPMEITREQAVHALELVLGIKDLEDVSSIPAISIERGPR